MALSGMAGTPMPSAGGMYAIATKSGIMTMRAMVKLLGRVKMLVLLGLLLDMAD